MLNILKSLDLKSIIILVLLLLVIISFSVFMFKRSENLQTIKSIKKENISLRETRNRNKDIITKLNNDIKIDSMAIESLKAQIKEINIQLYNSEQKTKSDEYSLAKMRDRYNNINNEISKLEKNTKVKTGNDLLLSIKEKTMKK